MTPHGSPCVLMSNDNVVPFKGEEKKPLKKKTKFFERQNLEEIALMPSDSENHYYSIIRPADLDKVFSFIVREKIGLILRDISEE